MLITKAKISYVTSQVLGTWGNITVYWNYDMFFFASQPIIKQAHWVVLPETVRWEGPAGRSDAFSGVC